MKKKCSGRDYLAMGIKKPAPDTAPVKTSILNTRNLIAKYARYGIKAHDVIEGDIQHKQQKE